MQQFSCEQGGSVTLLASYLGARLALKYIMPSFVHQTCMTDELRALLPLIGADFTNEYWSESALSKRATMRMLTEKGAFQ